MATATLIAIGTIITVAPTFDITCENSRVRMPRQACSTHGEALPRCSRMPCAIHAAVPCAVTVG